MKTKSRKSKPSTKKPVVQRIHCADRINAVIPENLRDFKITAKWLGEHGACSEGVRRFTAAFPKGATYSQVRVAVADAKESGFESWLKEKLGGDLATAGDLGTATAGEDGVISIEYFDPQRGKYRRRIGQVGENGIQPGKKYKMNAEHQFEEVKE